MIETNLLDELITTLKNQKRPEKIECPVYGQYNEDTKTFLYFDAEQRYTLMEQIPNAKIVRSVKAFAETIKEELKRRENESGYKATVKINLEGGNFIPDDNFGKVACTFNRLNSQQWKLVASQLGRIMNHKEFLLFLQALKPSINNFQEIYKSFSTLRLIGRSTLTSNPIITEHGQEEGYKCTFKLEDGCDGEERFPTGFTVTVPYAKAGMYEYDIPIDLLFCRGDRDEILIQVLCPTFENIEETALIDEANYVRTNVESYSDLLVLSDF